MSRKADHLIYIQSKENKYAVFSVCGRVRWLTQADPEKGPNIVSSKDFNASENQCLRCYRESKGIKLPRSGSKKESGLG